MRVPPLLPAPRELASHPDGFALNPKAVIVLPAGADDSDFYSAKALAAAVAERSGLRLPVETHARFEDLPARIELGRKAGPRESYVLEVRRNAVRARGADAAGLRYAVETLIQLLPEGRGRIPGCRIEDAPDLEKRGVLIDVSRGKVPTLETLKGVVDFMVSLKLNLLMLYTEHVFRFRRHPLIGRDASPMDAAELRELDLYASERHVELVPTLQSLGHMHHILNVPRYARLAESEKKWSLSPAIEETYALLDDLYSEYLPNFRSPWFNANCDEPVDLGKGLSKERAEREGREAIFIGHLARVKELARKYGKKTMAWADFVFEHRDAIARLPKDVVFIDWWYEADHDFDRVKALAENGIPFLAAAGTSSWNTLFPRGENALANIRGYADSAKRHGALGLITTDWGDNGAYNLLGNSTFALAFGAQAAWGTTAVDARRFDEAFSRRVFGDASSTPGRLYRRLGGIHQTGFDHFNHSPLKTLYFEDVLEGKFWPKAKPRVLEATKKKLLRIRDEFRSNESAFVKRPLEREELRFAIDASILAAEKGLASGRKLIRIATAQSLLKRRHEKLWLQRNHRSNFETVASYYDRSIASLWRAARRRLYSPGLSAGRERGR
jgi:hypothetical protein